MEQLIDNLIFTLLNTNGPLLLKQYPIKPKEFFVKKAYTFLLSALMLLSLSAAFGQHQDMNKVCLEENLKFSTGNRQNIFAADTNLYNLEIEVIANSSGMSYQKSPSGGFYTPYYGSFSGPVTQGKGLVLAEALSIRTSGDDANKSEVLSLEGKNVFLKFLDSKSMLLADGMIVNVSCRRDYEAVCPTTAANEGTSQPIDRRNDITWELDNCRISTPIVLMPEESAEE